MQISWTSEQIIALAPDDSSAKAGRGLASVSKWETIGCDELVVWGECRGSGKNPYQVSIDLSEPAFKCSCPSRKFPCKHGLGLFLLYAGNQIKPAGAPPAFCAEWLAKRAAAQDRKKEKSESEPTQEESAKREKARAKRLSEREAKVAAGLGELELWLTDLIRQGLAAAQSQPTEYWEKMARRLIDAQSPNAARLVREMSGVIYQTVNGKNRAENLLERIGKIYLLAESYKRINDLPPPVRADVQTGIGFSIKENELQNAETISDDWQTLAVRIYDEDKLRVQRIWLYGEKSGREALILNFAFQNQPLDASFAAGTKFAGKLAFYPGNFPQRAVLQERQAVQSFTEMIGHQNFTGVLEAYSSALAKNLWLETFPARLAQIVPVQRENFWFLRDNAGKMLPIDPNFAGIWKLFAVSGNRPVNLFAEWNGETLLPLTVWAENQLLRF